MPFIKLQFKPGVDKDRTDYSGEGGWWETEKVRFRSGYPQKIGGWTKYSTTQVLGACRQLWAWVTSFSDNIIALGTSKKVYLAVGNVFYDVTPLRQSFATTATDNMIHTTSGSTTLSVTLTTHGAVTGDYVTIAGATTFDSVPAAEMNANHKVTVVDANTFTFVVTTAPTDSTPGGGGTAITAAFELAVGNDNVTEGIGWGTGTWDESPAGDRHWGLGGTQPVYLPLRAWWFSHIDNDLIASIQDGAIYYWSRDGFTGTAPTDPAAPLLVRMKLLTDKVTADDVYVAAAVPVKTTQTLLSQQDKHLIAFGAVPYGSTDIADFDPLLIRWSDQDIPEQWTPQVTNSAGSIRLSRGSKIVRALPTRQEILVWTDSNLYAFQFLGTTDVFSVQPYADSISIASARACVSTSNITYWMGRDKFYVYSGRVETLPCTLRDHVFSDLDLTQAPQVVCGTNEEWNEVWWFYPSISGAKNWNDKYVVYNYGEDVWYHGNMERTAWMDSSLRDNPLAVATDSTTADGFMYTHEDGVDDDVSAMTSYIESSDFDLGDGEHYMLSRRMIPDISLSQSTAVTPEVTLQIKKRNFPGTVFSGDTSDSQLVSETGVGTHTNEVFIRARARQMAIRITSSALGVQWKLGSPRIDLRQDGRQ